MTYTNGTHNGVIAMIEERKPGIIETSLKAGRRRAADIAAQLSRRGALMGAVELINEVVFKLIELSYETDEAGLCNVDPYTGVYERFPMPWGRRYQLYGLKATEAEILALHVARLQDLTSKAPLFAYDAITRRWAVNIIDYPTKNSALGYWSSVQLDADSYRLLLDSVRDKRGTR
jgi:hypothetical protein